MKTNTIVLLSLAFLIFSACTPCIAQTEQYIDGWGTVVDPKGDCQVVNRAGTLAIGVPGTQHNLNPMPGWANLDAPRVLQEMDGDFTIKVSASKFRIPGPKTASNKEKPYSMVFSGLVIWQDGENFLRYARAANGDTGGVSVQMERFSKGKKIAWSTVNIADENTNLSVSRTKGAFHMVQWPSNTTKWHGNIGFDLASDGDPALKGKVKVGVFVINSTNQPITHEFTQLQLTRK